MLDCAGQAAVGIGRVAAAVGLACALAECQALPVEAGRAHTAFGAATAVVAMAAGAGQYAGGHRHIAGADPRLQLGVAAGDTFAVEALAGLLVVGEVQCRGKRRHAQQACQADRKPCGSGLASQKERATLPTFGVKAASAGAAAQPFGDARPLPQRLPPQRLTPQGTHHGNHRPASG